MNSFLALSQDLGIWGLIEENTDYKSEDRQYIFDHGIKAENAKSMESANKDQHFAEMPKPTDADATYTCFKHEFKSKSAKIVESLKYTANLKVKVDDFQ